MRIIGLTGAAGVGKDSVGEVLVRAGWVRMAFAEWRFQAVEQSGNGSLINGVVLTDVRFPDEAEMILRRGGVIWRVERPGVEPVRAHVSETAAAGIEADRIVVNDGTLLDLEMRVSETLRRSFL